MSTTAAPKKSGFDFRMSKKVAELTQVVHMLFTRNHEKEVEIEALKEAYEDEIDLVLKDALSRIAKLSSEMAEVKRKHQEDTAQFQSLLTHELERKEDEWRKTLAEANCQIQSERAECQKIRDLLMKTQKDIEKLKRAKTDESERSAKETELQSREQQAFRELISKLQNENKDLQAEVKEKRSLQQANESLEIELRQLRESGGGANSGEATMRAKIKELENEVRRLRQELSRKSLTPSSRRQRQDFEMATAACTDYDEEMGKIRKELEKYKLELRNREGNFNRMFTEKQPIFIDKRAGRFASMSGFQNGGDIPRGRYARERTYHPGTLNTRSMGSMEENLQELMVSPRGADPSLSSSIGVLPHLTTGQELNGRSPKQLVKPRVMSRELTSVKSLGH